MAQPIIVHVIGSGYGESIIIQMPGGRVGVVDCFCPKLAIEEKDHIAENPTLDFLVNHIQTDSLAFLAFTHPHEDHGRGISHILKHYGDRIGEIWVFSSLGTDNLQRYFRTILLDKRERTIDQLLREPPSYFSDEMLQIADLIEDYYLAHRPGAPKVTLFLGYKSHKLSNDIRVHFLGPSHQAFLNYERHLCGNIKDVIDQNNRMVKPDWDPRRVNHNEICPAFILEIGSARFIFGSDVENPMWERILDDVYNSNEDTPKLHCHFVKVSHHGSKKSYSDALYHNISGSENDKPYMVITPSIRHNLPSLDVLEKLKGYSRGLYVTNTDFLSDALPKPIPLEIADALRECRPFWGAFQPDLFDLPESKISELDGISEAMIERLKKYPALWEHLRPELAIFLAGDNILSKYTVTLEFNPDGSLRKELLGSGCTKISG